MNRVQQLAVWLKRLNHCRGFGIQTPDDYRFVRYVINEHWPYYAYADIAADDDWLRRKLGRLYMRLANQLQPQVVADLVGMEAWLKAGCQKSTIATTLPQAISGAVMILCDAKSDIVRLMDMCSEQTMLVVHRMWECKDLWRAIADDQRTFTSFDLYYCGIALFRKRNARHQYIVNF